VSIRSDPVALDPLDHPQRVVVVAEAHPVVLLEAGVEHLLADVTERRVAEVVAQHDRLRQVLVEGQGASDRPRDPGHLEGVREARAVVVALRRDEHLCLVLQPPERLRVDDPIAIALERRAQRRVRLGDRPLRRVRARRERREHGCLGSGHPVVEVVLDADGHEEIVSPRAAAPPPASPATRDLYRCATAACAAATRATGTRNGEQLT
jgi:hypothetical protein